VSGVARHHQPDLRRTPANDADQWEEIDAAIVQGEREESAKPHYRATLLPEGAQVIAAFVDVETGIVGKRSEKWFGHFRLIDVEIPDALERRRHSGKTILRTWNAPRRGWLSPTHALARDFAAVCGLPLRSIPKAAPRAILGAFLRGVFVTATTRVVKRRMDEKSRAWVETLPADWYSVIDRIDGLALGSPARPRYLSLRRRN
jgi:hypothetical protein